MLSLFPTLLAFEGFASFLLRLTLGAVFLFWGYSKLLGKLKKRSDTIETIRGLIKTIIGIALVVGFLTQLAALVSAILLGVRLVQKIQHKAFLSNGVNYYLILFIISLTLLVTRQVFFAFDLPL